MCVCVGGGGGKGGGGGGNLGTQPLLKKITIMLKDHSLDYVRQKDNLYFSTIIKARSRLQ